MRLRTSSAHEEGGDRHWNILTKRFLGANGVISKLETKDVVFHKDITGQVEITQDIDGKF